jgi:hypothetical protein
MICSVTARQLPNSTLNLLHAKTTNSGSQVQAVDDMFLGKCDIVEQSACQVADGTHKNVPTVTSTNLDTEADSIPTFAYIVTIIPCPYMTVVGFEHISRTRHPSSRYRTCVKWAQSQLVIVATRKTASVYGYHLVPNVRWAGRSVRSSLFWDVTHRRLVVSTLRSGTNY